MQFGNIFLTLDTRCDTVTLHLGVLLGVPEKFLASELWDLRDETCVAMRTVRMNCVLCIYFDYLFANAVVTASYASGVGVHIEWILILILAMSICISFGLVILNRLV